LRIRFHHEGHEKNNLTTKSTKITKKEKRLLAAKNAKPKFLPYFAFFAAYIFFYPKLCDPCTTIVHDLRSLRKILKPGIALRCSRATNARSALWSVVPAKAGIQANSANKPRYPTACAGMTG
jgi:hypothetical protein